MPKAAIARTKQLSVTLVNTTSVEAKASYCKAGSMYGTDCPKGEFITIPSGQTKTLSCRKRPAESNKKHENCLVYVEIKESLGGKRKVVKLVANKNKAFIWHDNGLFLSPTALNKKTWTVFVKNDTDHTIKASYFRRGAARACVFGTLLIEPGETKKFPCDKRNFQSAGHENCKIKVEKDRASETSLVKDNATAVVTQSQGKLKIRVEK